MNDDRDNSNIQSSSEGSSTEVNSSSEEKDTPSSEQSIESDKEDPTNKDSSVNGWLLLLVLLIVLGTGFYFYTYKKDSSFFTTLPDSLIKLFSIAPQLKNLPSIQPQKALTTPPEEVIRKIEEATSPDTQSKEIPAKFSREIVEQTKRTNLFNKTTNENEKTIDLLRDEIQSLKSELKEKSSTLQNFGIKRPHISGGFLAEESEEIAQQEEGEPASETKTLPTTSSPAKTEPLTQQNHSQKISPQRSKEVQAYLDFIENTGRKFIKLIKEGWAGLQALLVNFRGKYLKGY